MQKKFHQTIIELVLGDITAQDTDAIVNAANSRLAGGGGVDGAIHRAGGPEIMAETRQKYPGGCPTGQAVITGAGRLKARYVIHAVGPVYKGKAEDAELLASTYLESLKLADKNHLKSIAFPSISTGAYGYPIEAASAVALKTIQDYLLGETGLKLVRLVLFSKRDSEVYKKSLLSI